MIPSSQIITNGNYPSWLRGDITFKKISNIRKVFPEIKLPNFEVSGSIIDNYDNIYCYAVAVINELKANLIKRKSCINGFLLSAKIGKKRKLQISRLLSEIDLFISVLSKCASCIIKAENGTAQLRCPSDIVLGLETIFRKNEKIIGIYNSFAKRLLELKLVSLGSIDQSQTFKTFSSINIPAKKAEIIFSADEEKGVWDIATMSMRGIRSCQTWGEGIGNDRCVIGSMIDPFTGIIYLTSGENVSHGTKMMRRCIVKYVYHKPTNEYCLFLEKMYPAYDAATMRSFKEVLSQKSGLKVYDFHNNLGYNLIKSLDYKIPLAEEFGLSGTIPFPYVDSRINYSNLSSCSFIPINKPVIPTISFNFSEDYQKKIVKIVEIFIRSNLFSKKKMDVFGKRPSKLISKLRGTYYCRCSAETCKKEHNRDERHLTRDLANNYVLYLTEQAKTLPNASSINDFKMISLSYFAGIFGSKSNNTFNKYFTNKLFTYLNKK